MWVGFEEQGRAPCPVHDALAWARTMRMADHDESVGYRFGRIGRVFPATDHVARYLVVVSMALNDVLAAIRRPEHRSRLGISAMALRPELPVRSGA